MKFKVDFMARVCVHVEASDEDAAKDIAQKELFNPNNLQALACDAEVTIDVSEDEEN